MMCMSIPKEIHYCWFGNGKKSYQVEKCIASWKKLERKGYKIIEWNESNCDMEENDYIRTMYRDRKWAFISDYFRLKILVNRGGYLDTDVYVYDDFDKFLDADAFFGFQYDFALGTHVIGMRRGSTLGAELLLQYSSLNEAIISNGLVTTIFEKHVKGFMANNMRQSVNYVSDTSVERIEIYEKEELACGRIWGGTTCLHLCECSWGEKYTADAKPWKKMLLLRVPLFNYISLILHRQADYANEHWKQNK